MYYISLNQKHLFTCLLFFLSFSYSLLAQERIKVACIGNSVTYGYGLAQPEKNAYPAQLQTMLGDNYSVGNFGHSGATLLRKGHNPYYKTKEYKAALSFQPDIAVIHLGLNDTDPRNWPNYSSFFEQDYAQLIAAVRKSNPKVKIYICKMTPIFSGHPRFLSGTRDWYDEIQALIPKIAANNEVQLINLNENLKSRIDLFDDYLHPNKQGAHILAHTVGLAIAAIPQPLEVNKTLTSNMVLQRNRENLIFGTATPGEKIRVSFNSLSKETTVKSNGTWEIWLPQMSAGGPYQIKITDPDESILLENVLFGDVYLAAGQSNMAYPLARAIHNDSLIHKALENKNLRLFKAKNLVQTNPVAWDSITLKKINDLQFFHGKWELPTSKNAASFSAVAYSFAQKIVSTEDIPIGIIDISVGGSTTESWISRSTLENDNLLANYIHSWKHSDFIMDFCKRRAATNLGKATIKHQRHPYGPAYNYEAGISNWLHTQLKGVLWYQGASNAHNIELHHHLFKTLVQSWRKEFHQDLPFYFVQLPSLNRPSWGKFRNDQRLLEDELKNIHMAVTLDLGNKNNVHPSNKIPVGHRLAKLVRRYEYGQNIHAQHPEVINLTQKKDHFLLKFSHAKKLKTLDKRAVKGFQAMDLKGNYHPLKAKIIGRKKVQIDRPAYSIQKILYGFKPFTPANLCNEESVPISTFSLQI